jgi:hypothetical protein
MPSGGQLMFCAHHGRAHHDKLRQLAADLQDDTTALARTPATAPDAER